MCIVVGHRTVDIKPGILARNI